MVNLSFTFSKWLDLLLRIDTSLIHCNINPATCWFLLSQQGGGWNMKKASFILPLPSAKMYIITKQHCNYITILYHPMWCICFMPCTCTTENKKLKKNQQTYEALNWSESQYMCFDILAFSSDWVAILFDSVDPPPGTALTVFCFSLLRASSRSPYCNCWDCYSYYSDVFSTRATGCNSEAILMKFEYDIQLKEYMGPITMWRNVIHK